MTLALDFELVSLLSGFRGAVEKAPADAGGPLLVILGHQIDPTERKRCRGEMSLHEFQHERVPSWPIAAQHDASSTADSDPNQLGGRVTWTGANPRSACPIQLQPFSSVVY